MVKRNRPHLTGKLSGSESHVKLVEGSSVGYFARWISVAVAVALPLALAACGDGEEKPPAVSATRMPFPTSSPVPARSPSVTVTTEPTQAPTPTREPLLPFADRGTEDLARYLPTLLADSGPYFGTKKRDMLLEELEDPTYDTLSWFISIRSELAFDLLNFGEFREAVRLLEEALEAEKREDPERRHRKELQEELALAYIELAEQVNCLSPTGSLVCALPLDNSLSHEDKDASDNAKKHLMELLELEPQNIKFRWLLNVVHMTLGTYPEGLSDRFLIPPDVFESEDDIGLFREIAPYAGLFKINLAGGSIIDDFDRDGLLDIVVSTWHPGGQLVYYHNDGNGSFSDYTERAGLTGQVGGLNIVQTDYNNDGWVDIVVMRGGWQRARGQVRTSLLRNDEGKTFTDVTHEAGIAYPAYPSQFTAWEDYDADGDLDFFACNESMPAAGISSTEIIFPSQLFRNEGDGTFTDVASQSKVTNLRYCKSAVWGDYDNDGDPDLYVSNFGSNNRLYRNDGDGAFTDVAPALGVEEPILSFPTWFWDYDNDGWLDLFVAGFDYRIADVALDFLGLPNDGSRMRLFKNDGAGGFIDVTREAGLYEVHLTMGANYGDMDNDGYPDFYLGTGYPSYESISPNIAFRNVDGERFADITVSAGLGHLGKGHGVAFGDLDRDGDQDIFEQTGGFYPADNSTNALYENPGHGNHWISVRLEGVESNRAAVGARIKVEVELEDGTRRHVYDHVNIGGTFGASPLEQEIGLGRARRIASLEVYWPTTGRRQVFYDLPMDSHIQVIEGDPEFKLLDIRPFRLQSPR